MARLPRLLTYAVAWLVGATLVLPIGGEPSARGGTQDLAGFVDPFIGTGTASTGTGGPGGGHVFPGAVVPHGMVQWSPDTTANAGGYRYWQSNIRGFGVTHFSGRGCRSYQDFPFMPHVGPMRSSPASNARSFTSSFSHRSEQASPGSYKVRLDRGPIHVALTAGARSGLGAFTYPASRTSTMLIDAGGSATGNIASGTGIRIVGDREIVGRATSGFFCGSGNRYRLFLAARFDRPVVRFGTWEGDRLRPATRRAAGSSSGAYVSFDTTVSRTVRVKVGLSFVSVANARLNMAVEIPGWSVRDVRAAARSSWNRTLGSIRVRGGTLRQKTIFYTALYHALIHPNVFSDVNREYIGFDHSVHVARGYTQYENFPGWDMYRSQAALLALLEPRRTSDILRSLLADARQGGGGLPRWEVANDNSGGMVGDPQDVVLSTAYALGARGFDAPAAFRIMLRGASVPGTRSGRYLVRPGLERYLQLGYVPLNTPGVRGAASTTLEYEADDFALARLGRALGHPRLAAELLDRAHGWRAMFDPATGFIEPRHADGSFPASYDPTSTRGFVEGDGAQYTWMVPFDVPGLMQAMGGPAKAVAGLDGHLARLNEGPQSVHAWMGNEPELSVPWAYDFAGAPSHTQSVVRRVVLGLYRDGPDGLPGNDDGGALSSWYVFAAMGLYPAIPGIPGFAVGSPLFPWITVGLRGGQLRIVAPNASASTPYVHRWKVNEQVMDGAWLPFAAIARGGTLAFTLSDRPG